jgi:hypothetical protein
MEQEGDQLPPVQASNLRQQKNQLFGHQPRGFSLVFYLSWNCILWQEMIQKAVVYRSSRPIKSLEFSGELGA